MKDNRADMKVAEKISKLDTLGAGIVYGKEEAWDKLQARMDKKPTRLVPLRYRAAAAAMLLLFVGIVAWYRTPEKEVAVRSNEIIKTPVAAQPPIAPLQQQTQTPEKEITIRMKHAAPVRSNNARKEDISKITIIQPAPAAQEQQNAAVVAVVNIPAPVTPVNPMKVIHINDLENGGYKSLPAAGSPQGIALNKLPVVHINELEREAVEVKEIMKNNRMTFGHIPFSKPDYDDYYLNAEGDHQRIQFLKLRNTQN